MQKRKPRNSKQDVTMGDIAKKANVSKMTVSRAFTNTAYISEASRAKVLKAADSLGYSYNALAAGFASGRSKLIGVAVNVDEVMRTTYFTRLYKAASLLFENHGYHNLILDTSSAKYSDPKELGNLVSQRRVDAVLGVCLPTKGQTIINAFNKGNTSTLLVGNVSRHQDTPSITFDNDHAIKLLLEHLIELGHRKIAYIGGPSSITDATEREKSYLKHIKRLKLSTTKSYLQPGDFEYKGGREATEKLLKLKTPPTAIICSSDRSAVGAYEALRNNGLTPGKEISICGIDNTRLAGQVSPPLTTVAQPLEEMGRLAAQNILHLIDDKPLTDQNANTKLQGELIIRASTAPCPQ